jgi:hypothetical protein
MNYYKITNENECHRGLQYHDGLNIDTVPFNPSGDCEPGGIYYAKEDILAFVSYGCWIRKVEIPTDARTYANPGTPVKWKSNKVFLHPRKHLWNVKTIKKLIAEGADPKANDSYALRWASKYGHTEVVKILIPVSDPKTFNSAALRLASRNGHYDIVKLLISLSDPACC